MKMFGVSLLLSVGSLNNLHSSVVSGIQLQENSEAHSALAGSSRGTDSGVTGPSSALAQVSAQAPRNKRKGRGGGRKKLTRREI